MASMGDIHGMWMSERSWAKRRARRAGSAPWKRWRQSRDVVFAELMAIGGADERLFVRHIAGLRFPRRFALLDAAKGGFSTMARAFGDHASERRRSQCAIGFQLKNSD